jgi:uncharacterized protein with HEPN domain
MSKKRSVIDDLNNVIETMNKAEQFIADMDYEDFLEDEKTLFAVSKAIELIGETLKHIPEDIKDRYSEVPWDDIYGMRNFLAHNYFASDQDEIWQTLKEDIPKLKPVIMSILEETLRTAEDPKNPH